MSRIVTVAMCYSRGKGDVPNPQAPPRSRGILLVLEVGVVSCSASLRPEQLLAQHGAQASKGVWCPEVPVLFLVCHHAAAFRVPNRGVGVNFSS